MHLLTRNHKIFIVLAAFIYFIAGMAIGFHHHAEGDGRHFDCPICTTGSLLSTGGREDTSTLAVYLGITLLCQSKEIFPTDSSILPIHAPRAPPFDPIT
jgi:hypothetical protein